MTHTIVLKKSPKIEFQFLENGFELIDEQTKLNSGFYPYEDLRSIELNRTWFPTLAKWLRAITWIFNGVPLFPDAESCKKANVIFDFGKSKLGLWLTDAHMTSKAKKIKELVNRKIMNNIES